jgi:hypothetical protein
VKRRLEGCEIESGVSVRVLPLVFNDAEKPVHAHVQTAFLEQFAFQRDWQTLSDFVVTTGQKSVARAARLSEQEIIPITNHRSSQNVQG